MSATYRQADRVAAGNPFSTRYVRPGALEFEFPSGTSAPELISRLAANGWRGEIIGPHGSGKSTLLATLLEYLAQTDRRMALQAVRAGERPPAFSSWRSEAWNAKTLVVVDGYERLGWLSRRCLDAACRRQGAGLLVTAHHGVGFPLLYRTSPAVELLQALVTRLLPEGCDFFTHADVVSCYDEYSGNLREALFRLYDLYELRRRA